MNHDTNATNGEDDETPEEMVNRSLAQAYDNQQRYMELFQHSAHMLQVLSRFMADPIVVHDLEEDTSDNDTSSTTSDSSTSPASCAVHASVSSPPPPSLTDVPQTVLCEIVEASLNSMTTDRGISNRRPQSCRVRPREQVVNRIGWSSDTDSRAATQHRPGAARPRQEACFPRRSLYRSFPTENVCAAEGVVGDCERGRFKAYSSPCSPLSTTCRGSTSTSTRQDTDLDTGESSLTESGKCSYYNDDPCCNNQEGIDDLSIQNAGEGDGKQITLDIHSSVTNPSINENETTVTSLLQNGETSATSTHNYITNGVISEGRAHRFEIGMSTQASIKNAMSEISKAADTIRQARSMLSSLNLAPGVQMNNNNHEPSQQCNEAGNGSDDNDDVVSGVDITENCVESNRVVTNILKLVQPMEPTLNSTIYYDRGNDIQTPVSQHLSRSPKPILVKPAAESRISLMAKPNIETKAPEPKTVKIPVETRACSSNSTECNQRGRRSVSFVIPDNKYKDIPQNWPEKAMTYDQIMSTINNRTTVVCGLGNSSSPSMFGESSYSSTNRNSLPLLNHQTTNTVIGTQTENNVLDHPHINIPNGFRRKLSPNSFNSSVMISVNTFQQALNEAIQTLENEGIWPQEENKSKTPAESKVDNNHFVLQNSSSLSLHQDKPITQHISTISIEKLENSLQVVQYSDPTDFLQEQVMNNEETTEVLEYESSKHSLISHTEEVSVEQNVTEQIESLQDDSITLTPIKPFTDSEEGENDREVRSIVFDQAEVEDDLKKVCEVIDDINDANDYDGLEMVLLKDKSTKEAKRTHEKAVFNPDSKKWEGCWVIRLDDSENIDLISDRQESLVVPESSASILKNSETQIAQPDSLIGNEKVERSGLHKECSGLLEPPLPNIKHSKTQIAGTSRLLEEKHEEKADLYKEKVNVFKRVSSKVKGWFKKKS